MPTRRPKFAKELAWLTQREIIKNALRSTKKKRTKYYKETLGKAATKTQQWLKNIGQIRVFERFVHLANLLLMDR